MKILLIPLPDDDTNIRAVYILAGNRMMFAHLKVSIDMPIPEMKNRIINHINEYFSTHYMLNEFGFVVYGTWQQL